MSAGPVDKMAGGVGAAVPSAERVELRFPADLPGVELWTVKNSTRPWSVYHTTYGFCSVERLAGRQTWWYRRRTYHLDLTSTMTIEPGEMHVTKELPASDFHVLLVAPSVLDREFAGDERLRGRHFSEGQLDDAGVVARFHDLCRAIEDTDDLCPLTRACLLRAYLALVFGRAGETPPRFAARGSEPAVRRAREYIHACFARPITLDELAAAAGVCKFHLEREFSRNLGLPLHQYLLRVRVALARDHLARGVAPADTADLVGFSDQAHMTRVFRGQLGFSPGQYFRASRRAAGTGQDLERSREK